RQRAAMEAAANREPDVGEFEPTVGDQNLATIEVSPREYLFHTAEAFGKNEGFLPAGETCILAAPGGCGKTYLALQAAIAAACGGTWLHARALEPVGVLYLAGEENADELARRFQSILRSMGLSDRPDKIELINKNLRLHSRLGKHERLIDDNSKPAELFTSLDFFLNKHPEIKLVVLDPASKYMGSEVETNNAKAQDWVNLLSRFTLSEGKPSILVVHHIRKEGHKGKGVFKVSEKDQMPDLSMDDIRGSSGIVNGFRWALMLARQRYEDHTEKVFLRVTKTNYSKQSGTLQFDPDENNSGILKFNKLLSDDDVERNNAVKNTAPVSDHKHTIHTLEEIREDLSAIIAGEFC
ncbi:MAG: AAA family ATPase, partial [Minisyncoccia bacterium]